MAATTGLGARRARQVEELAEAVQGATDENMQLAYVVDQGYIGEEPADGPADLQPSRDRQLLAALSEGDERTLR